MFINALRYREPKDEEFKTWRFSSGINNLTNFISLHENNSNIAKVHSALIFGLTGKPQARIHEVAIQLSDFSGDSWVIERNQLRTRILRNGVLIKQDDAEEIFYQCVFDLDETVKNDAALKQDVLTSLEIKPSEHGIGAYSIANLNSSANRMRKISEERQWQLTREIAKIFNQPLLLNESTTVALAEKLEPIFLSYKELLIQRKELLENSSEQLKINPQAIDYLMQEIELINTIENVAKNLLDPKHAPKVLQEKLQKLDEDLQKGYVSCSIEALPNEGRSVNWQELIETLTKLECLRKMIESSEKSYDFDQNVLNPIYEHYLNIIGGIISNDTQITAELESCLSTLNEQVSVETKKALQEQNRSQITKFLFPRGSESSEDSVKQVKGKLEKSRVAVDYALTKLGELHANIEIARNKFEQTKQKLQQAHEKVIEEYGDIKEKWFKLAAQNNIPENFTIAALLKLISRHGYLLELWQKRQDIIEKIKQRNALLSQLETLVIDWRSKTGSQKDNDITNPAILLAETKGILRYKQQKIEQLERLKHQNDSFKMFDLLRNEIDSRIKTTAQKWAAIFQDYRLPPLPIRDKRWVEFFNLARDLKATLKVISENKKPLQGAAIMSEDMLGSFINIFICRSEQLTEPAKNEFIKLVKHNQLPSFQVILSADQSLMEELIQQGSGRAFDISKAKTKTEPTPSPQKPAPPEEQSKIAIQIPLAAQTKQPDAEKQSAIIKKNQRAQDVLKLLTAKRPVAT